MILIRSIIKEFAERFNGVKEVGNNDGWEKVYFEDLKMTFEELMITVGWKTTHAWCAYFGELVWKLAYAKHNSLKIVELDKLFSASAVTTWRNFKKSDYVCNRIPDVGCVVVWQNYKAGEGTIYGHVGIVISVSDDMKTFKTIEGNTNAAGSREGDQVAEKTRKLNSDKVTNGLSLLGFIHPKEV